jgi:hypothetical protein
LTAAERSTSQKKDYFLAEYTRTTPKLEKDISHALRLVTKLNKQHCMFSSESEFDILKTGCLPLLMLLVLFAPPQVTPISPPCCWRPPCCVDGLPLQADDVQRLADIADRIRDKRALALQVEIAELESLVNAS